MLRIVAGKYKNRRLMTLQGQATRPTLEKVREAVFSSLGTYFDGGAVLDLYAGSGAIGLEAISRGKNTAVFVDNSVNAIAIIKQNVENLQVAAQSTILKMTARKALFHLQEKGNTFDLVYLDPPYRKEENETILSLLQQTSLLESKAIVVLESRKEDHYADNIGNLTCYKETIYGISKIRYYHFR